MQPGAPHGWRVEDAHATCNPCPVLSACCALTSPAAPAQTMDENPFADFVEIPEEHRCACTEARGLFRTLQGHRIVHLKRHR